MRPTEARKFWPPSRDQWIAIALFVFALGFRCLGIGWGLANDLHNESYHPDEQVNWAVAQQVEPAKLQFTTNFYSYGTLYFTVLGVASDITEAYFGGPGTNEHEFWMYVSRCHIAGRLINSLAGAGTVVILFFILRRRANLIGAVFGALLPAVAPGFVVHSRFQTVDVFATFLFACSIFCALAILRPADLEPPPDRLITKLAVWSGIFAGLSAGTKYTGLVALLTLFVALFYGCRPSWIKLSLISTGAALLAFLVATPGAILQHDKFWYDFTFEMKHVAEGHGLVFAGTSSGFVYHLGNLALGVGPLLTLLGVAGLAWACAKKQPWAIAVAASFLFYYIVIGRSEVKFLRYTFPLYVGLGLGFGWLISEAQAKRAWGRAAVAAGILAVGGVDGGGLRGAAVFTQAMMSTDARDQAAIYLKSACKNQPTSTVGLVSDPWFYSPPLFPDSAVSRAIGIPKILYLMSQAREPAVIRYVPADLNQRFDWDARLLDLKPDYVVYSNFEYDDLYRLSQESKLTNQERLQVSRFEDFLKRLSQEYQRDQQFGDAPVMVQDMQYVRPVICIWKRKPNP